MKYHYKNARRIAILLDSKYKIFGIEIGLDPLLGLIPGLGEAVTIIFSLYIFYIGWQLKIPTKAKIAMLKNIAIDAILGTIPVVGDIADFFYKANMKNLQILENYYVEDVERLD